MENGGSETWYINSVDWEKYQCRGEITDYFLDGNVLTINQETAWCEQEGVRQIIEEKYPSIKVYFMEEEPGCEVFYTNDASGDYFPERFFLDSYEGCEYFETIEEAARYVSEIVGRRVRANVEAICRALDAYEEKNQDLFYSFHEFTVI